MAACNSTVKNRIPNNNLRKIRGQGRVACPTQRGSEYCDSRPERQRGRARFLADAAGYCGRPNKKKSVLRLCQPCFSPRIATRDDSRGIATAADDAGGTGVVELFGQELGLGQIRADQIGTVEVARLRSAFVKLAPASLHPAVASIRSVRLKLQRKSQTLSPRENILEPVKSPCDSLA